MTPDKQVKILATLGPAIGGIDDIRELVEAGVNIFRLNFSHGEHADHAQGMAERGDTLVITAGVPTNSLRIETLI